MTNSIAVKVSKYYGDIAQRVSAFPSKDTGLAESGTPEGSLFPDGADPISARLYDDSESRIIPEKALQASLGCGNPTRLYTLKAGQKVLDLGSGGGIDVLLAAQKVAPSGHVFGLDMTPAMLELARENQKKAGVANVTFLQGEIEAIPLPEKSIDVIISNCVINLSTDKEKALQEAFRVLKPGGDFAISDLVFLKEPSPLLRQAVDLWAGCLAGALEFGEYERLLKNAGFADIGIEPTRVYSEVDIECLLSSLENSQKGEAWSELLARAELPQLLEEAKNFMASAFVRARKPE